MAARTIPIEEPDDPALQPYTAMRERDLVGREGLFVAEGEVVVRVLVERSRFAVRSLLLERRRVGPMRDVIDALAEHVPVYAVPQSVMDAVVGFSIHRGVLALGERGPSIAPEALAAGASVLVGLVGLANHDNVGGIFRNAAAFGAGGVLLDPSSCDPLYRKAIRVSAGAALVVPFARCASAGAMLDALEAAGVEPIALTPRGDETIDALRTCPEILSGQVLPCSSRGGTRRPSPEKRGFPGSPPHAGSPPASNFGYNIFTPAPRALLLGAEGPGLPDEILARTRRVRIDMAPGLDSLNVAVASGIALHEATRALRRRR